jgi:hypothetical protein
MRGRSRIAVMAVLCLTLGSCGAIRESRFNPLNWFGRSQSQETLTTLDGQEALADNRALVTQVTSLTVDPLPTGAIVAAGGLPPTQGWWDAELVAENDGDPVDGVLTLRFVVGEPPGPRRSGTPQSREVTAAYTLSNIDLQGIAEIVVVGETNSRSSRR